MATTEEFRLISSPNYPGFYPNNADITFIIHSPNGTLVKVTFLDLAIQDGCNFDNLIIYDGKLYSTKLSTLLWCSLNLSTIFGRLKSLSQRWWGFLWWGFLWHYCTNKTPMNLTPWPHWTELFQRPIDSCSDPIICRSGHTDQIQIYLKENDLDTSRAFP